MLTNFIKKYVIRTKKYNIRKVCLLGIPLYQYVKIKKKNKTYKFYSLTGFSCPKEKQRIFYLKVHRVHRSSIDCIRQWVHIAEEMNAFIYFVCDNPLMYDDILKNIIFSNKNFDFIKSDKITIKPQVQKILHNVERYKLWERIAFSMMTPFIHAHNNKYYISYNIDADDILLCAKPKKIAQAFFKAENYAQKNNIDLFNLDMFLSKSFGVHWSFGVVICTNPEKCLGIVKRNINWRENKALIEKYKLCYIDKYNFNVDWLFTFLRDTQQLNMKTFYIEDALVTHMPDIILEHGWAFMSQWKNEQLRFPILSNFYKKEVWDTIPIPPGCIKFDVEIEEDDYKDFLRNFYDFGVGFELDMLLYAKERGLMDNSLFQKYAQTKEFIRDFNLCSEK